MQKKNQIKQKKNHRYNHLVSYEYKKTKMTVYECFVEKQLNRSRKARVILPGRR